MEPIAPIQFSASNPFETNLQAAKSADRTEQVAEASKSFEAMMLRQFLNESMKPMFENGIFGESDKSGVYQYLVVDNLANAISQGEGLGLSSMIEFQLNQGALNNE